MLDLLISSPENSNEGFIEVINDLRQRLHLYKDASFDEFEQLADQTESRVFYDRNSVRVLKVVKVDEFDFAGIKPTEISNNNGMLDIGIGASSIIEFLDRIDRANAHGGIVFSIWLGITEDGDLVFEQPYIQNRENTVEDLSQALSQRGLLLLPDHDRFPAVGKVGEKWILFFDLHKDNVLIRDGETFIVDAQNREMTQNDWDVLETLDLKDWVISEFSKIENLRENKTSILKKIYYYLKKILKL